MTKYLIALACLFSTLVSAQSTLPSRLDGARFAGPQNPVELSSAHFSLGLSSDDGSTFKQQADRTEPVEIIGYINPQSKDIGKKADIFIVDRINLVFMMKNAEGYFVPWNGMVADLAPAIESVTLEDNMQIDVFTGALGVSGDHRIFLGYVVDGELHYTPQPLRLDIRVPLDGSTPGSISLLSDPLDFAQGRLITFTYSGPVVSAAKVGVYVRGKKITSSYQNNQISFIVPHGLSGSTTFYIVAENQVFAYSSLIEAAPVITNPKDLILTYADNALSLLQGDETPEGQQIYSQIQNFKLSLNTMSAAQIYDLAVILQQNVDAAVPKSQAFFLKSASASDAKFDVQKLILDPCDIAMQKYVSGVIDAVQKNRKIRALLASGMALLFIEPPAGMILIVAGLYKAHANMVNAGKKVEEVLEACISPLKAEIERDFGIQEISNALQATSPNRLELKEDALEAFSIKVTYGFATQNIRTQFLDVLALLKIAVSNLPTFITSKLDLTFLTPDTDNRIETADHKLFTLSGITAANISGTVSGVSSDALQLKFNFINPLPSGTTYQDFSFTLASQSLDLSLTVPARITPINMRDKLIESSIGLWMVEALGSPTQYKLELKAGGVGKYIYERPAEFFTRATCRDINSSERVGNACLYPMTWNIVLIGGKYFLEDYGFWNLGVQGEKRDPVTLPVTSFYTYGKYDVTPTRSRLFTKLQ
ncbi:MAG: hypothetical protein V4628_09185 [Pseudomonadota bacterium]